MKLLKQETKNKLYAWYIKSAVLDFQNNRNVWFIMIVALWSLIMEYIGLWAFLFIFVWAYLEWRYQKLWLIYYQKAIIESTWWKYDWIITYTRK